MTALPTPLPGTSPSSVVVPAPGPGFGMWAGAPSAAVDDDGGVVLAYRLRAADTRGSAVVVGRLADGDRLTPLATLERARFAAASLERPSLVRTDTGAWRLYVSCATPGSKHWRVDVLEADDPSGLASSPALMVFPGDDVTGVKDPVVRRTADGWRAWVCCHPLDVAGEEDRMYTRYATSADGLAWQWHDVVLTGRPGEWDARGARVTALLPDGSMTYDGRASKEENFAERTGVALAGADGRLHAVGAGPVADVRYLDVLPMPSGDVRLFYEAPLADGSHELRTELVPRADERISG